MVDNVSFSGDGAPSQHDTPVFSSSARWEYRVCPPAVPLQDAALTADPYCKQRISALGPQTRVKKVEIN